MVYGCIFYPYASACFTPIPTFEITINRLVNKDKHEHKKKENVFFLVLIFVLISPGYTTAFPNSYTYLHMTYFLLISIAKRYSKAIFLPRVFRVFS